VNRSHVTACILAGGRARRMGGVAKPLLQVDGVTILERQRRVLGPRVQEIIVALAGPGPMAELGLRAVFDTRPDAGPLAGITAALAAITTPWLLAVAGDMPELSAGVIDLLLAGIGDEVDAVAARLGGWPEPLCALWHRRTHTALTARLQRGQYKVADALTSLSVAWIDEAAIRAVDPDLDSFRNLNRPDEL
jgi:molybdenum cofactor guanylyltransferase